MNKGKKNTQQHTVPKDQNDQAPSWVSPHWASSHDPAVQGEKDP